MNTIHPIEKLSNILKWLSLIFLIIGIFGITIYFLGGGDGIIEILDCVTAILVGLIPLSLANGLLKKEKWAFYSSIIIFGFIILLHGTYLLFNFSFQSLESLLAIAYLGGASYLLYLLINGRQIFTEQPKEKISQWFRKSGFIILILLIAGSFIARILYIVFIVFGVIEAY